MRSFEVGRAPQGSFALYAVGLGLMGFGVLIILLPQLLIVLIAALSISAGALLTTIGWRLRQGSRSAGSARTRWFPP